MADSIGTKTASSSEAIQDEVRMMMAQSKQFARLQAERARLLNSFDRKLDAFDRASPGSADQIQLLEELEKLEQEFAAIDPQLVKLVSALLDRLLT